MRFIEKTLPEPSCLATARRTATVGGRTIDSDDWGTLPTGCAQALRDRLYADQRGLCAYCGCRIATRPHPETGAEMVPAADRKRPQDGGMSIEHWIPRSGYPNTSDAEKAVCGQHTLEWGNLLGVCVGKAVGPSSAAGHCDHARRDRRLYLHPCQMRTLAARFRCNTESGELRPTRGDDEEATADIQTLNLNLARLKANRAAAINQVRHALMRDDSPRRLRQLWRAATESPLLTAFAPAVASYLDGKLRARGLSP